MENSLFLTHFLTFDENQNKTSIFIISSLGRHPAISGSVANASKPPKSPRRFSPRVRNLNTHDMRTHPPPLSTESSGNPEFTPNEVGR